MPRVQLRCWRWLRLRCLSLLVVLLVLVVAVVASCGRFSGRLRPIATVVAQPPTRLVGGMWERITLPAPSAQVQGFAVSPRDPSTLFACAATLPPVPPDPAAPAQAVTPQPFTLWRSTDVGAHWERFAPLDARGTGCAFAVAPDDPQRVTFQVAQFAPGEQLCGRDTFYLSSDGGASWRQLPQHSSGPANVSYGWCDLQPTARHLFLLYSFAPANGPPQISLLERSDDDGVTWTRADAGVSGAGAGENALYFMPQLGPGERLAMTVLHLAAAPMSTASLVTELWTSPDAGRTWTRTAALPEHPGTFLWSAPPQPSSTWPNAAHPFYALQTEQIPSDLYREGVLASGDGQHWALVPPLPVPGTDGEHRGILQALAALPDGRLAVWGANLQAGVPAEGHAVEPVRPFWLWLWSPVQARWQLLVPPLDVSTDEGCGLCWQAQAASTQDGAQFVYVWDLFEARDSGLQDAGVWRVRLPKGG